MQEIKRCQKCIMPTALPSVQLDEKGVCNHCRTYEKKMVKWLATKDRRQKEWQAIVASAKEKNGRYDCLIPLSGGKDSTYALYACAKLYGLKCLCITFNNGYMSPHALENIRRTMESCDADYMTFQVNRKVQLQLYKMYLTRCGSFCAVCMRGISESIYNACNAFSIPLIVTGGGWRVSYLKMFPELFQGPDQDFFSRVAQGSSMANEAKRLGAIFQVNKMPFLSSRIKRRIRNRLLGLKKVNIYNYLEFDRRDVLSIVSTEMGWQRPAKNFEHTDCLLHSIAGYTHTLRFPEMTPETAHLSGQIRFGEISREEALRIEEKMLTDRNTPSELQFFLEDIEMTNEEFVRYASDFKLADKYR